MVDSPATCPVAVVSLMVSFVDFFDVCVPTGGCESPVDVDACEPDVEPGDPRR